MFSVQVLPNIQLEITKEYKTLSLELELALSTILKPNNKNVYNAYH